MSKDKTRTRSASANNAADTDKPNMPAEFTEYVRNAFEKMNVKMDSIITGQVDLERKFETVTAEVTKNMDDIGEIQHAIDYHCDRITDTVRDMKDAAVKSDTTRRINQHITKQDPYVGGGSKLK